MEDSDLNKAFDNWNPMEDDHSKSEFNLYDSGPAAGLDVLETKFSKPHLVFKRLPKGMTKKSIKNLCQRHVKVENCYERGNMVFVYFHNIADMEAIYRTLANHDLKFKIEIGRHFLNQNRNNEISDLKSEHSFSIPRASTSSSDLNLEARTIIPSGKKPKRPEFTHLVKRDDALRGEKSALLEADPLQNVLKQSDAHNLERAGIKIADLSTINENDYNFRTGRAFLNIPTATKNLLKNKYENSVGHFENGSYCNRFENEERPDILKCLVCSKPTDKICYRCVDKKYAYCSAKCQNEDFEIHRQICGKPKDIQMELSKQMSKIANLTPRNLNNEKHVFVPTSPSSTVTSASSIASESSSMKSFPIPVTPPSKSHVIITAITRANTVFIRSTESRENIKFFELINKLQKLAGKLKPLENLPRCGEAVIAEFQSNGEYARALVLGAKDEENIRINFMDYGNVEVQKLTNLYKAPSEFIRMKRFAVPVLLKNVPDTYMTENIRSFLYSYLRYMELIVQYDVVEDLNEDLNLYQVDLFDAVTKQHLNKTIKLLSNPEEPKDCDEIVSFQDLEIMEMPVGNNIEFFVMDNSQLNIGCISCTTKAFLLEIEMFRNDLQNYANSCKPQSYAPRVDELCIAKYTVDGQWYRGRCLEKVGDGKPTIHYFDYGNIDFVSVQNIRPYPPKFNFPIYTADCEISGLPKEVDEKVVKRLEEIFPSNRPIRVDSVEFFVDNFYSIKMKSVLETLKKERLLD